MTVQNGQKTGQVTGTNGSVHRYRADLWGTIANQLASHAGIGVVMREIAQNADDAYPHDVSARLLCFDFRSDALVSFNDAAFSAADIDAIRTIGLGAKVGDVETGGAFGVGFVSVFQLTDRPEIRSGHTCLKLDPIAEEAIESDLDGHVAGSEIRLPYRTESTPFSERIRQQAIDKPLIDRFLEDDARLQVYRHLLFLRRVNRIEVARDGHLLFSVTKTPLPEEHHTRSHYSERLCDFTFYDAASDRSYQHQWVVFGREIDQQPPSGKHGLVRIAFCHSSDELADKLAASGRACALLPTEMETECGLFFDADFFPEGNRKSIIAVDSDLTGWNHLLLEELANLTVDIIPRLTELAGADAGWFYRQLPAGIRDNGHDVALMHPFCKALESNAATLPLVRIVKGEWVSPPEGRYARRALFDFARDFVPELVEGVPGDLVNFLQRHKLPVWTEQDLLETIADLVVPGSKLDAAHPIVRGEKRLRDVYAILQSARTRTPQFQEALLRAPILLATDGSLWPARDERNAAPILMAVDSDTREILTDGGWRCVDAAWQTTYEQLFKEWSVYVANADTVIDLLRRTADRCSGYGVTQAHPLVNSLPKLDRLLLYLDTRLPTPIDAQQLAIFPDQENTLRKASELFLCDDLDREVMGAHVRHLSSRYTTGGMGTKLQRLFRDIFRLPTLRNEVLLDRVGILLRAGVGLEGQSHFSTLPKLLGLYRYLYKRVDASDLTRCRQLRHLPMFLTSEGVFAPAEPTKLYRHAADLPKDIQALVPLPNLIDPRIVTNDLEDFFSRVVDLHPMQVISFITYGVLDQWDKIADPEKRYKLLKYIAHHIPQVFQDAEARRRLEAIPVICCEDGAFRRFAEVYYPPSPELDRVLGTSYPTPSTKVYGTQGRLPKDGYRWHDFFGQTHRAGIGPEAIARPGDLVKAISAVTTEAPTDTKVETIRNIYLYLSNQWESYEAQKDALKPLATAYWLPASGHRDRWHRASELYMLNQRHLVATQARCVEFALNIKGGMAQFLGGPKNDAPVPVVARHLLAIAGAGSEPERADDLYKFLGSKIQADLKPTDSTLHTLREKRVIWDPASKHFWLPQQVFTSNVRRDFGAHRLSYDWAEADARRFLRFVGARDGEISTQDRVQFLLDLFETYGSQILAEADRELVLRQYYHLQNAADRDLAPLRNRSAVLAIDGRLHTAEESLIADSQLIAGRFRQGVLTLVENRQGLDKLMTRLGVRRLSEVAEPELANDVSEATRLATREEQLRDLCNPLRRAVYHVWRVATMGATEFLNHLELVSVPSLIVRYRIATLEAVSEPFEVAAHRDGERIYVARNGLESNIELAWALASALAPADALERDVVFLASLVERVISSNTSKAAMDILSRLRVIELPSEFVLPREDTSHPLDGPAEEEPVSKAKTEDTPKPERPRVSPPESRVKVETGGEVTIPKPTTSPPKAEEDDIPPYQPMEQFATPRVFNDPYEIERMARELTELYGATAEVDIRELCQEQQRYKPTRPDEPAEDGPIPTVVQVTLFAEDIANSRIRWTKQIERMLSDVSGRWIECQLGVEDTRYHRIYLNRAKAVLYHPTLLAEWFTAESLVAGAIVRLHRMEGPRFRLDYIREDCEIRDVQILFLDGEGCRLEKVDQHLHFRVDEEVFRGEKRFEDIEALYRQAHQPRQRGAYQTLLKVFQEAEEDESLPRHSVNNHALLSWQEIRARCSDKRLVSTFTIRYLLQRNPCFRRSDGLYWLDPALIESRPHRPPSTPTPRPTPRRGEVEPREPRPVATGQEGVAQLAQSLRALSDYVTGTLQEADSATIQGLVRGLEDISTSLINLLDQIRAVLAHASARQQEDAWLQDLIARVNDKAEDSDARERMSALLEKWLEGDWQQLGEASGGQAISALQQLNNRGFGRISSHFVQLGQHFFKLEQWTQAKAIWQYGAQRGDSVAKEHLAVVERRLRAAAIVRTAQESEDSPIERARLLEKAHQEDLTWAEVAELSKTAWVEAIEASLAAVRAACRRKDAPLAERECVTLMQALKEAPQDLALSSQTEVSLSAVQHLRDLAHNIVENYRQSPQNTTLIKGLLSQALDMARFFKLKLQAGEWVQLDIIDLLAETFTDARAAAILAFGVDFVGRDNSADVAYYVRHWREGLVKIYRDHAQWDAAVTTIDEALRDARDDKLIAQLRKLKEEIKLQRQFEGQKGPGLRAKFAKSVTEARNDPIVKTAVTATSLQRFLGRFRAG